MSQLLGNKKIIRAWTLFDWSNSVYQLSITSAILPAYFIAVAKGDSNGLITFFGFEVINTSLYAWAVSASFLFVALFSPLLSSIADYTGRRKFFMQLFTWIGALSCSMLFFFDKTHLELGIIAFTLAGIGYSGGLVFYNAWLPEIAPPGQEDRISARGYALGYTGGIVLLVINLAMILKPDLFGITQDGMAARISFVTVGIWWLGFSQITFYYLPTYTISRRSMRNPILNGYRELLKVWSEFKTQRQLKIYLAAFFFIMMAVLTVMYMAANFGKKELNLDDQILIPTVLLIQIIGIIGSIGFARFSERFGNIPALQLSILIWIGICIAAYYVIDSTGFIVLASFVGLVMGGVQSLARSTYTKLLPQTQDHTSYFSFYDVTEKLAVVFGTFLFGLLESITGSMRTSILMLGILFVIGFFLLLILNNSKQLSIKEK